MKIYTTLYKCFRPVMLYGGGGGTSGAFTFPTAAGEGSPTAQYSRWICDDLDDMMDASWAGDTPFTGETTPDPELYMAAGSAGMSQKEMNDLWTTLAGLNNITDWREGVEAAVAEADESDTFPTIDIASDVSSIHSAERTAISSAMTAAISAAADAIADTPIAGLVTAYEARIKKQYLRAMSRLASSMADINAVNSSAFIFGMASINRQMLDDVDHYDAGLDLETYKVYTGVYMQAFISTFKDHLVQQMEVDRLRYGNRDAMIMQGATEMARLLTFNTSIEQTAVQLQAEINRIRYNSLVAEHEAQLNIDFRDSTFDYELTSYGSNMLASSGGAAVIPPQPSTFEKVVGGISSLLGAAVPFLGGGKKD